MHASALPQQHPYQSSTRRWGNPLTGRPPDPSPRPTTELFARSCTPQHRAARCSLQLSCSVVYRHQHDSYSVCSPLRLFSMASLFHSLLLFLSKHSHTNSIHPPQKPPITTTTDRPINRSTHKSTPNPTPDPSSTHPSSKTTPPSALGVQKTNDSPHPHPARGCRSRNGMQCSGVGGAVAQPCAPKEHATRCCTRFGTVCSRRLIRPPACLLLVARYSCLSICLLVDLPACCFGYSA